MQGAVEMAGEESDSGKTTYTMIATILMVGLLSFGVLNLFGILR